MIKQYFILCIPSFFFLLVSAYMWKIKSALGPGLHDPIISYKNVYIHIYMSAPIKYKFKKIYVIKEYIL